MPVIFLPAASRGSMEKVGKLLPETIKVIHAVTFVASVTTTVIAAIVVPPVVILIGTTRRLFLGGTFVPARLLVGGAAPAGVIERHKRCSSQQCLSSKCMSANLASRFPS